MRLIERMLTESSRRIARDGSDEKAARDVDLSLCFGDSRISRRQVGDSWVIAQPADKTTMSALAGTERHVGRF